MHITPRRYIGLLFIVYTPFSCSVKRKMCSTTALSYRSIIKSMKNHENYWTCWDMPFINVVEILRLFWYHIYQISGVCSQNSDIASHNRLVLIWNEFLFLHGIIRAVSMTFWTGLRVYLLFQIYSQESPGTHYLASVNGTKCVFINFLTDFMQGLKYSSFIIEEWFR